MAERRPNLRISAMNNYMPSLSIIIPTLNCRHILRECLNSVYSQDYPKDRTEVLIADGGSRDGTIGLIEEFAKGNPAIRLLDNSRLKTGEAGKAIAASEAKNQILAFIDSDNILTGRDWFLRMVEPFSEPEIMASEPIEYTYRKTDGYITRYCALMGMNDPLCFFLGNYDRYNAITSRWTDIPHKECDKGNYIKVELYKGRLPTIGANGFLIRKDVLNQCAIGDYLFDIDVIATILENSPSIKIAKVKIGIVHIFAGGFPDFARKQKRRIKDYMYYKKRGLRKYEWSNMGATGILKFIVYTVLLLPLIAQAITGYMKKRDRAWFFHIPACVATLIIYSFYSICNFFNTEPASRDKWQK